MKKLLFVFIFFVLFSAVSAVAAFVYFSENLPTIEQISQRQISQSTKIYERTGSVLLYEISNGKERTVIPLEDVSKYLKDATIAIEDERFYEEPGFSWRGIMRSFLVNLSHGGIVQGGSTITQQLARNAFLSTEQTISRKVREVILAIKLTKYYSKDQILASYLNEIPYGPTIYGVEAASEAYFSKPASDLGLAESAVLVAIPKAPTYYSPWGNHVKELMERQKLVIEKMFKLGKISEKERDEALASRLSFSPRNRGIRAPHFVMAVQDYLVQKYGEDKVREGGLNVITTLDWKLQQAAERAISEGAKRNEGLYAGKNAALVAQNPKTGEILSLVGSRDYFDVDNDGNFDVATQGLRQPGSALKPFVYLTAFSKGYTPDTILFDVPTEFTANNPLCPLQPNFEDNNKKCFHPENFDGEFRGPVLMRQALSQSINIPAVKTLYLAGLGEAVENAYKFGLTTLTSPDLYGLSLVLGGGAVRLIDLVGAYSVLAEDGIKHDQIIILEVKDSDGKTLESFKDKGSMVFDAQPVRLINNILSDSESRRGLFQGSFSLTVFPDHDVALKTGTSNDYRDAWALGYTPSLVVGVWAGNNDNSPMQRRGSSILAAVPIWHDFMAEAVKDLPVETFRKPDPTYPQKPVLAGDYLANRQVHSILYYVDRKNPDGPYPLNPSDDPQFNNWESGVLSWAQKNIPDFGEYNKNSPPAFGYSASTDPGSYGFKVNLEYPPGGSFVGGEINIRAKVSSLIYVSKMRIYWNGLLAQEVAVNQNTTDYDFIWTFSPPILMPQNLLEVEAVNQNGQSARAGVIVYGK
ncbi:MAG: transglycosylase domain-containing protein [Patescibacteria group bacterium]|mgnify:CR=1 FL=1